jgi:hypothetical protein
MIKRERERERERESYQLTRDIQKQENDHKYPKIPTAMMK